MSMTDGVNPNEVPRADQDPSRYITRKDGSIYKQGRQGLIGNVTGRKHLRPDRMAGNHRNMLDLAEQKAMMSALWKDGENYADIADKINKEFGLTGDLVFKAKNIAYHISNLKQYWRDVGLLNIDEKQALLLARLDQLEMMCIEAYYASCEGKTTSHYEKSIDRAKSKDREKDLRQQIRREREERKSKLAKNQQDNPKFLVASLEMGDDEMVDAIMVTEERVKEYERLEENPAGDPRWVSMMIDIADKKAKIFALYKQKGPDDEDMAKIRLSDEQRQERLAAVLNSVLIRKQTEAGNTNLAPASPLGGHKTPIQETVVIPESSIEVLGPEAPEPIQFDFSDLDPNEIPPQSDLGEEFW